MKQIFNIEKMINEVIEYSYFLYDLRGIIFEVYDNDWLHDILLIDCNYENYILDNDEYYELFCSQVEKIDVNQLNLKIKKALSG